jgi:hypothetical protein
LIFDLNKVPKLEPFLKAHEVDTPDDVMAKINGAYRDVHQYSVSANKGDFAVDTTDGKLYRIDDAGAHAVLPESTPSTKR